MYNISVLLCRLRVFDTTVMVVQLLSHSEAEVIKQTEHLVSAYSFHVVAPVSR